MNRLIYAPRVTCAVVLSLRPGRNRKDAAGRLNRPWMRLNRKPFAAPDTG